MFLTNIPIKKQSSCNHQFKIKHPHGSKTPVKVCIICNHKKQVLENNEKITTFFDPASEQTEFQASKQDKYQARVTIQSFVEQQQINTNWLTMEYDGWRFPATSEPYCDCGVWKRKGCLNTENHKKSGYGNTVFVKQYKNSCYRPICSICYYQWIIRQANRSARRVGKYAELSKRIPFHLVLSVSLADHGLSYKELKKKQVMIAKELGVCGAAVIFHPFRLKKPECKRYYYSPHFHLVCFGEIKGRVGLIAKKYGWFIKYKGPRDSVFQTFCYLLSHCGIRKGFRSLVWTGVLSYGKLKLEKEPETNICPCCKVKLVEIYKEEYDPVVPPDDYFEGFVDPEGWYQIHIENTLVDDYDYSSTRHLNEILKGIATAN
jgi:hypothetical protein